MSIADLDGLCLQKVLQFVAGALELVRLDVAGRQFCDGVVTAVAESERRVRALSILSPDPTRTLSDENAWFPYSQVAADDEQADDLETLLQRAVSWAGGWHGFLAAREGLLDTHAMALPTDSSIYAEPLLLWELLRDGVTMHRELAPTGAGLKAPLEYERVPSLHVPRASRLGDSCSPYATRADAAGNSLNDNRSPIHPKGAQDRFQISVPASDCAIWCARVSLLAPNKTQIIHELEFDTGWFATNPQGHGGGSRTLPDPYGRHMQGGSGHQGVHGPYEFIMLRYFNNDDYHDEGESDEEEEPDDNSESDVPELLAPGSDDPDELLPPEFQIWTIVDHCGPGGQPEELPWKSTRIHLNFRLMLDDRILAGPHP